MYPYAPTTAQSFGYTNLPTGYSATTWQPRTTPVNNIIEANGPESAKAFNVGVNGKAVLIDTTRPVVYLVTGDGAGYSSVRTFKIEEIADEPDDDGKLDEFKAELSDIRKQMSEMQEILRGLV